MADTIPEIIDMARKAGLDAAADRLDYLYNLPVENGDEPMNVKAVKLLVTFMSEHPEMSTDVIGTDQDGFVHVMWDITQSSQLHAQFFPSGNVMFIYATDDNTSVGCKILKKGDMSPNDMLREIMPLVENLM